MARPATFRIEELGDNALGVRISGRKENAEPAIFRIVFPWGDVEVVRATDGAANPDYWVHVRTNHPQASGWTPGETTPGEMKDARLDQVDKPSIDADLGDFGRPELYHLAVRIGAKRRSERLLDA